jgi:hypothetical protein
MNVLDENFTPVQRQRLQKWRIPVRHIGYDIGRKGMTDENIIPFLLTLPHPTLFTEDWDYFDKKMCHPAYCLVQLDVQRNELAIFVRRFLRHKEFKTRAARMGAVIRVSYSGLTVWRWKAEKAIFFKWES